MKEQIQNLINKAEILKRITDDPMAIDLINDLIRDLKKLLHDYS